MESYTDFLKKFYKQESFKVIPLAGDASTRRYFRVLSAESGNRSDTAVLMSWDPFKIERYPFLSVLNHFAKHNIKVPQVRALSPEEGFILLEDLGDLTLERKFWENQQSSEALPYYKQSIDELIKIHFLSSKEKTDCTAFEIMFDTEKLLWELNYGRTHLLEGICKWQPSAKVSTELQDAFVSISEKLHNEPKFIAHRDYHSRNLMIKFDEVRVIDFQDARLGPIQYDLVSLLKDSYVNLSDEMSNDLMAYYLEQAREFLPALYSKEHFYKVYELQSIQRCFKACGSFASFLNMRQDKRYVKYINGTLKRVLKSVSLFPEYKIISDIIIDSGSLDKGYETL
jgi:N-acetylmuramate 1-kinase